MKISAVRRLISIGLVVILVLIFSITSDAFFTSRNIYSLLKDAAFLGLIALGASFVMVGGGVDLSAGGIVCFVGIICARISMIPGMPGVVVVLAGVLIGAVCGIVNGMFVTKIHLTEFVTTLATGFVFSGMGLLFAFRSNGNISGTLISKSISNRSFLAIGKTIGGGPYIITIVWIVAVVLMYLVMKKTTLGLHTYATGSNLRSAQMSGVNTTRIKVLGYVISGAAAGLAAALALANIGAATSSFGSGYEFQAIAACVVGGIVLGGGKGDVVSAAIGSLFMIIIWNGLLKYGLLVAWQYILQGGIIVIMTAFDTQFYRLTAKRLALRQSPRLAGGAK